MAKALIQFVAWTTHSFARFAFINALYFGCGLWFGLILAALSTKSIDTASISISFVISFVAGLLYAVLMWNSFFVKKLRNMNHRNNK